MGTPQQLRRRPQRLPQQRPQWRPLRQPLKQSAALTRTRRRMVTLTAQSNVDTSLLSLWRSRLFRIVDFFWHSRVYGQINYEGTPKVACTFFFDVRMRSEPCSLLYRLALVTETPTDLGNGIFVVVELQ